jgi:hypothetical protein
MTVVPYSTVNVITGSVALKDKLYADKQHEIQFRAINMVTIDIFETEIFEHQVEYEDMV